MNDVKPVPSAAAGTSSRVAGTGGRTAGGIVAGGGTPLTAATSPRSGATMLEGATGPRTPPPCSKDTGVADAAASAGKAAPATVARGGVPAVAGDGGIGEPATTRQPASMWASVSSRGDTFGGMNRGDSAEAGELDDDADATDKVAPAAAAAAAAEAAAGDRSQVNVCVSSPAATDVVVCGETDTAPGEVVAVGVVTVVAGAHAGTEIASGGDVVSEDARLGTRVGVLADGNSERGERACDPTGPVMSAGSEGGGGLSGESGLGERAVAAAAAAAAVRGEKTASSGNSSSSRAGGWSEACARRTCVGEERDGMCRNIHRRVGLRCGGRVARGCIDSEM